MVILSEFRALEEDKELLCRLHLANEHVGLCNFSTDIEKCLGGGKKPVILGQDLCLDIPLVAPP